MPNNKRNKNKNRSRSNGGANSMGNVAASRITRVTGQGLLTFVISAATAVTIPVSPDGLSSFISRFGDLMETYQLFRFTRLKLRCYAPHTTLTSCFAFSQGDPTVTTASQVTDVCQFPGAVVFPPTVATVNTFPLTTALTLSIGRGVLIRDSPNKWWRTQPSAAVEVWEENQGELVFSLSTSGTVTGLAQLFYDIEFTSQIAPALIPKEPALTQGFIDYMSRKLTEKAAKLALKPA